MAQRFKASELKDMIRTIVREEMKDVVGRTINEFLSERYLKDMARRLSEAMAVARPRGVASLEQMGEDAIEEDPPRALAQDNEWPYQKHPIKKDDEVKENADPMSIFFEGTRPITEIEAAADEAPATKMEAALKSPEGQNTVEVWRKLAEGMDRKAVAQKQTRLSPEEQMRAIEERRKKLEVKVG